MPRQPAVRAANTTMRACGSLTASGRMPALDHRAVCQWRGSSNDHSMALVTTGARNTRDNMRLMLRPKFRIGSAPPWLVRSRYHLAHRYDIADAAARNCGGRSATTDFDCVGLAFPPFLTDSSGPPCPLPARLNPRSQGN